MFVEKKPAQIELNDKRYLKLGDIYAGDAASAEMYLYLTLQMRKREQNWSWHRKKAKEDMDIYEGNTFTPAMLKRCADEGMTPVADKSIKRMNNIIVDNVFRGRQIGVIKQTLKDDKAIPAADIGEIINKMEIENNYEHKHYKMEHEVSVTGFFNYMEWEIEGQINGNGKPVLLTYSWDCILPAPMYDNNFIDCNDIIKINFMTPNDIRATFPERTRAIDNAAQKMFDQNFVTNFYEALNLATQKNVNNRIKEVPFDYLNELDRELWTVYDWVRPMYSKTDVYVAAGVAQEVILPVQWEAERVLLWESEHPEYQKFTRYEKILWRTVWTAGGVILYNGEHWYQENCKLNGCLLAFEMTNRQPDGFIRIAEDLVRMQSMAETEGLYQILQNGGKTTFFNPETIKDPVRFRIEMQKRMGYVEIEQGAEIPKVIVNEPNTSFLEYGKRVKETKDDVLAMTEDIRGRTKASSSNFRTETAILQTMTSYGEAMRNCTEFNARMKNIAITLLPYVFTEEEAIILTMPEGEEESKEVVINQQELQLQSEEDEEGNKNVFYALTTVANDPTRGRYAYVVVKDSPSALSDAAQIEDAMVFLSGVGNTILQINPEMAARIMAAMPNTILSKLGRDMLKELEKQRQQAQQGGAANNPMAAMTAGAGGQAQISQGQPNAADPAAAAQMQEANQTIPQTGVVENNAAQNLPVDMNMMPQMAG